MISTAAGDPKRRRQAPSLASLAASTARHYRDQSLASDGLPEPPRASLAFGAAGVAYFLLRHASFGGGEASLQAAARWAAQADRATKQKGAFVTDSGPLATSQDRAVHYHQPGVWWVGALVAAASHAGEQARAPAARFAEAAADAHGSPGDVNWGSAGLLLGCAQLIESVDDPAILAPVNEAATGLAADLAALARRDGAVPGETSLGYLGAAHGWAGVAHALLRWSQASGTPASPPALELLERLVALRRKSGRWPIRAGSREVWRGWCHGSAGWAQTWTLAWRLTGEERFINLAEHSAEDAVADDTPNASLCCGRAGQGFAALTLYRATGEHRWLGAARRVAEDAARKATDDDPAHRLFSGQLGVALLAAELDDPTRSAMPVYESIS